MFREVEYHRELRELDIITEEELNQEFGMYGWKLASVNKINSCTEYLFWRNKPLLFQVWISDVGDYFKEKTIDFHWYADFMPRGGDRFNPMDFLYEEETEFINKHTKEEDWLNKEGLDAWKTKREYNESNNLADCFLSDFLIGELGDCFIDELQITHNRNFVVNIWLHKR